MPNIAVSPAPAKMPVASGTPSGKFSAALANASANTQETPAKQTAVSAGGQNGNGTHSADSSKGSTKNTTKPSSSSSEASPNTQSTAPATPEGAKIPAITTVTLALPTTPESDAQQSSDADTNSDSGLNTPPTPIASSSPSNMLPGFSIVPSATAPVAKPTTEQTGPLGDDSQKVATQPSPISAADVVTDTNSAVAASEQNVANDPAKIAKAVAAVKNAGSGPPQVTAFAAKVPVTEVKATPHETVHLANPIDPKPVTSVEHKNPDVPQASPATPGTADIKPELLQQVQSNDVVAGKSDRGIALPSSTSKHDGDAAKNPPPSDKSDSTVTVPVTVSKQDPSSPAVQPVSGPNPNDGSVQSAVPGVDSKGGSASVSSKASDAAPKGSDQFATALKERDAVAEPASTVAMSPLQVAKLVERAGQTELRVGIQAGEFGSVDIRTSMARSQFSAEISVERGELGRALTAELPSLHNRLAEQRLPMPNITLQDHSAGNQSGDLRQGTRQNQYQQSANFSGGFETDATAPILAAELAETSSTGLDIHM